MGQYNFEGDLDNINERQLQYIHSVILDFGFETGKVTFEPVGKPGDNYAALVKRIIVEGENRIFKMIAKIAPSNEVIRQVSNSYILFKNEHTMYFEVLPKLVQLQKEAGIPEEEQLKYATCYGSFTEQPNEVILLEDLQLLGFKMLDRFQPLPNDCIKSVLKNFALLHSLSHVLKHKEPDTFNHFKENLIDMWSAMTNVNEMKFFFQTVEDDALATLEDPNHINLTRDKIINAFALTARLSKADNDNKYSVIVQGDSWTNNIMFRFEDEQLAESLMIDYQISKIGSPVYDIMYMIFSCTDHEMRSKHYYDWIDYYHSEFEKSLYNFNLKVTLIYPREKLDADLKRYGKFMFGISILVASMLIKKPDDAAKMLDVMKSEENMKVANILEKSQELSITQSDDETKTRFKDRIVGLINSFSEFGLL